MPLELRDWLLIIGVFVVVLIGWEVYRSKRARQQFDSLHNDHYAEPTLSTDVSEVRSRRATHEEKEKAKQALKLGESVPILMNPIHEPEAHKVEQENDFGDQHLQLEMSMEAQRDALEPAANERVESLAEEPVPKAVEIDDDEAQATLEAAPLQLQIEPPETADSTEVMQSDLDKQGQEPLEPQQETLLNTEEPESFDVTDEELMAAPAQVLVMNVMAKGNRDFNGQLLLDLILSCQLKYADMDIFHFKDPQSGKRLFSLANGVHPGTFDLDRMSEMSTPALAFFMQLPNHGDAMKALDYMYKAAEHFARHLDASLQDDRHSVFTQQTLHHYQEQVKEFNRSRLLHTAEVD